MMGRGSPLRSGWRRFAFAAICCGVGTVGFASVLGFGWGGDSFVTAFDDIGEGVAALLAGAACLWTAGRSEGRMKRGWVLMASSAAAWGLGEAVWSYYEVWLGARVPVPSGADAGFLLAVPLAIAGILSFWTVPRGTAEKWRVWLDAVNIVLALTYTAWALGLKAVVLTQGSLAERVTGFAYPFGDILIGAVLILGIRRATRREHGRMLLLLAGLAANSLADSVFAYITATGALPAVYNVIGSGWVVGYMAIALSALWPVGPVDPTETKVPIDLWQIALPWAVVLVAAISALVAVFQGETSDPVQTVIAVAMAVMMMVGQVLAHKDTLGLLVKSRRSEAMLSEIITEAPIGIVRADPDFKILGANQSLGSLMHRDPTTLIGSRMIDYVPTDAREALFDRLRLLLTGVEQTVEGDSPLVLADGTRAWTHWKSTAVKNSSAETDYFLTTIADITGEHEARQSAKANLAALEGLNAIKAEFFKGVRREFRDTVARIRQCSVQLRDSDELASSALRTVAGGIYQSADRLDNMITAMLELEHSNSSRAVLDGTRIDLNTIIAQEVRQLRLPADGTIVQMRLQESLPRVNGDGRRLAQVVRTLLHKAVKYSPPSGQITVTSRLSGDQVEVIVKDQGAGVLTEFDDPGFDTTDVFAEDPIFKLVGAGLGLGIARNSVRIHGGRIWVERAKETGSESHFTIPIARDGFDSVDTDGDGCPVPLASDLRPLAGAGMPDGEQRRLM